MQSCMLQITRQPLKHAKWLLGCTSGVSLHPPVTPRNCPDALLLRVQQAVSTHCRHQLSCSHEDRIAQQRVLPVGIALVRHRSSGAARPKAKESPQKQVTKAKDRPSGQLSMGQKAARAGKDATYTGIVIVGIGVTGLMFFAIGRELLSSQSPSGVYGRALKACRRNEGIAAALGEPIKGYGEMNRRGRRRYVSHNLYERDGVKHMRMQFYLEGPSGKATVHLEVKKGDSGKWEYRYLFADTDDYPRRTFIVEDHR